MDIQMEKTQKQYFNFMLSDEQADEMGIRRGFTIVIGRETLERHIQEEIWAQTFWPSEAPVLNDICKAIAVRRDS